MKQLAYILILSLLIIGSASVALAQSWNEDEYASYSWVESPSQKNSFFLELWNNEYREGSEFVAGIALTSKGYREFDTGNGLVMNDGKAKGVKKANFEHHASEIIEMIKEAMEVTLIVQAWTKKLRIKKMRLGTDYELSIRTDVSYGKNGPSGLIELELIKIIW